jgi:hypothetical protein
VKCECSISLCLNLFHPKCRINKGLSKGETTDYGWSRCKSHIAMAHPYIYIHTVAWVTTGDAVRIGNWFY